MENTLTEGINIEMFEKIIVNVDKNNILIPCIDEYEKEESKQAKYSGNHNKLKKDSYHTPLIYSIRNVTKNKTEDRIIELIQSELGIIKDEATIWNKIVCAISQISIRSDTKSNGK